MLQKIVDMAVLISIHALREESDPSARYGLVAYDISIHALREESNMRTGELFAQDLQFLSTLSVRRATAGRAIYYASIAYFYPRSP